MDLISLTLTLTLRPLPPANPVNAPPPWWGRAAHALLLDVIRQYDGALASQFHDPPEPGEVGRDRSVSNTPSSTIRPFTVSTLLGRLPGGKLDTQGSYTLRLSGFQVGVTHILQQAAESGPLAVGKDIELDYLPFTVLGNTCQASASDDPGQGDKPASQPWTALTSYADLAAPYLLARTNAPRRIGMHFASPTTFKSGGKHVPLPLPGLVFGSLLERWNAFAPIAFPAEVKRYAEECLALSAYRLSTRPVPAKGSGMRIGFSGEASFASLNYDRYWMSVIATLAEFSLFSGVGAATTSGMGQCRRVEAR